MEHRPKPVPTKETDLPCLVVHTKDGRGNNFVVRWARKVRVNDGDVKQSVWFNAAGRGEAAAFEELLGYLRERFRWQKLVASFAALPVPPGVAGSEAPPAIFGPVSRTVEDGKRFHGWKTEDKHGRFRWTFRCHVGRRLDDGPWEFRVWSPVRGTF